MFRLLSEGEIIKEGDERYAIGIRSWESASQFVGEEAQERYPIRRKITADAEDQQKQPLTPVNSSSASSSAEQISAYIEKEMDSLRRGCGSNTWDILEGLQKLLLT